MHPRSFRTAEATSRRIMTTFEKGVNVKPEVELQIIIASTDWVVNFPSCFICICKYCDACDINITQTSYQWPELFKNSCRHSILLILFLQCEIQQTLHFYDLDHRFNIPWIISLHYWNLSHLSPNPYSRLCPDLFYSRFFKTFCNVFFASNTSSYPFL